MQGRSTLNQRKLGRMIAAMRSEVRPAISQERLAELAGVSRTHMGEIERGTANVTWSSLLGIARGLHVKPSVLVARAGF